MTDTKNGETGRVEKLLEMIIEQNAQILEGQDEIMEKLDNISKGEDGFGFETDIYN